MEEGPRCAETPEAGPLWLRDYLRTMVSVHLTLKPISSLLPEVNSGKVSYTAGEGSRHRCKLATSTPTAHA